MEQVIRSKYKNDDSLLQNNEETSLRVDKRRNLKVVERHSDAEHNSDTNSKNVTVVNPSTDPVESTLATALAGEDLTNDLLKVEQRYTYAYVVADTLVKTGAGFLHTVTFSPTDAAATAGTIFIYDKTTEATPTIFSYTIPAAALVPVTVILDVSFTTGLYIGFTTTADVAVTLSYR